MRAATAEPIESTSNWLPDDGYVSLTTAPALIQRSIERQGSFGLCSACEKSGLKPSGALFDFRSFPGQGTVIEVSWREAAAP